MTRELMQIQSWSSGSCTKKDGRELVLGVLDQKVRNSQKPRYNDAHSHRPPSVLNLIRNVDFGIPCFSLILHTHIQFCVHI